MTRGNANDPEVTTENANAARHIETYRLIEKNPAYRVGVGARAPSTQTPSLFVEIIINLTAEKSQVDLVQLGKALKCLKSLQERGYSLTFEDGTFISCEKELIQHPNEEYKKVKSLLKAIGEQRK